MKVALVYDRVNKWGGAERVLLALHEMFPDAPLFTAVYNSETASWAKVFPKIHTSFLQNFPAFRNPNLHHLSAPFLPLALESFDFSDYDLVVSVSSEAAKGIITKPETRHVCYLLTPTRYLWSDYDLYFSNPLLRLVSRPIVSYLRRWDKIAAQRSDKIIGISKETVGRIKKYYGREAGLVYPPVDVKVPKVGKVPEVSKGYFLVVSRLVPYKRVDLVIEVFNRLKHPLVIVGSGTEEGRLRRMAGSNITLLGSVNPEDLWAYYKGCVAFIAPHGEDFGIAIVEAQAAGKPVIAYKKGGATETVIEGKTGVFFKEQTVESLRRALENFDPSDFAPEDCIKNAQRFSKRKFFDRFAKLVSIG